MERVSDEWLERQLCVGAHVIGNISLLEIDMDMYKDMIEELLERRKAEMTQEREKAILPLPVKKVDGVSVETCTVKQWFQKINEELDELKEVLLRWSDLDSVKLDTDYVEEEDYKTIADEGADTITAITSMLEAMGIEERQRQEAQKRVNEANRERGRL